MIPNTIINFIWFFFNYHVHDMKIIILVINCSGKNNSYYFFFFLNFLNRFWMCFLLYFFFLTFKLIQNIDILFWYFFINLQSKKLFLVETMIIVKNLVFTKINKTHINKKKISWWKKKSKWLYFLFNKNIK